MYLNHVTSQVEILCRGQPVLPTQQLQNLVDLWFRTASTAKKVPASVGSSAKDFVMVLSYCRKVQTPWQFSKPNPVFASVRRLHLLVILMSVRIRTRSLRVRHICANMPDDYYKPEFFDCFISLVYPHIMNNWSNSASYSIFGSFYLFLTLFTRFVCKDCYCLENWATLVYKMLIFVWKGKDEMLGDI